MKRHGNGKRMFKHKAATGAFSDLRAKAVRPGGPLQPVGTAAFQVTGLAGFRPLITPSDRPLPTRTG